MINYASPLRVGLSAISFPHSSKKDAASIPTGSFLWVVHEKNERIDI